MATFEKGASVDPVEFVDLVDAPTECQPSAWRPVLVPRAAIEQTIERLAAAAAGAGAPRSAEIIHPQSHSPGRGMAPGLSISINVVLPGETVVLQRNNATRFEFCIGGCGTALIGGRRLPLKLWSGWNIPSMVQRQYQNAGPIPLVWLSYSNAPLLEKLGIYYSDRFERADEDSANVKAHSAKYQRSSAPDIPIGDAGARLRGYEFLTDIAVVENNPLLWPFEEIEPHMAKVPGDGKRTIMLLYNPATERRNGTTHSFFATVSSHPAGTVRTVPARGHKHSSFACNYHFRGAGSSVVDGERVNWEAGDLLFSAPSWSEHAHGSTEAGSTVLTIQDHPFQIGIESLIWQEAIDGPILTLGSEPGQTGYVGPRLSGD